MAKQVIFISLALLALLCGCARLTEGEAPFSTEIFSSDSDRFDPTKGSPLYSGTRMRQQ